MTGSWSSLDSFGARLDGEILEAVTNQFSRLEPMVRVRLLLSTLFLPAERRDGALRPALERLAEVAASEDDEWVRVVGAAVGRFDGRLHIEEVIKESTLVRPPAATVLPANCSYRGTVTPPALPAYHPSPSNQRPACVRSLRWRPPCDS